MASPDIRLPTPLSFSFFLSSLSQFKRLSFPRSNSLCCKRNLLIQSTQNPNFPLSHTNAPPRPNPTASAGRSKKTPGGPSPGRIEGDASVRREAKRNARRKSKKLAESLFYRLKNPHRLQADNFSEEELQMIGLGYDRMVRFMDKDDPNLRHPYDWYKYGEFGPYSWRGIVVGDPIRGRFSDEGVSLIGEVKDHEEWEEIEQFEMSSDFGTRLSTMGKTPGFRHFWVFIRHPRWNVSELPWEQWTLVCEVAVQAGDDKRLDKWSLMGRFGNSVRAAITKCAAWMRPDIIYVKRPVYQCRFEPQDEFFSRLFPLLDPGTENNYLFELKRDDGRFETSTYFGGLCKMVKVNPKAFVDDVVKGYEKLNEEGKWKCLEFLLKNHPYELLHPYTREWKMKLDEMELGCDAPDEDDDEEYETRKTAWDNDGSDDDNGDEGEDDEEEKEEEDEEEEDEEEEEEDAVVDIESVDKELGTVEEEEDVIPEENEKYWEEEFRKALSSSEAMERLVKRKLEKSTELYKKQLRSMEENRRKEVGNKEERISPKLYKDEWDYVGSGTHKRRIKKNKIPPALFLKAAVRPFTYRNLVKEIVLLRHAIIDGDIGSKS